MNRFFELNEQILKPFNITKNNLKVEVSNNTATVSIQNHADYQGSITINLSVIPQFSSLENLIKTLDQLENNDQQTVLNRFIELNKALFERENVKITSDQLQVQVTDNTAKITLTGNKNYQGSVDVSLVVKKQFDTIQNLQKDINQLVDTNQTTVLNRFFELNEQILKPFNITKNNLKVEVSQNTATVSIQNHAQFRGSITINLSVIPQFSSLENLIKTLDQLENNDQQTVLNRFIELNKTLFERENVKITSDQLQVQVTDNTAKITLTGNKNYQGSVDVSLVVKKDISTLELNRNAGVFDSKDANAIIDEFFRKNKDKLNGLTRNELELVGQVRDNSLTVKVKNTNTKFQGEVIINFTIKAKINEIRDLNKNLGKFDPTDVNTIISQFIQSNNDKLTGLTKDSFDVESNENGLLTIKVKPDHQKYQGSITITYTAKDELFSQVQAIVKEIKDLKNNDKETVLNKFWELNHDKLNLFNVTREQLDVIVNDNVATVKVINNENYYGSIQINLNSFKISTEYLDVLENDDINSILKAIEEKNNWKLDPNSINIDINGNTGIITGKEHNKKFISSIKVMFGLKATYSSNDEILTRIGFFKNNKGEWCIEQINNKTGEVPEILPSFITILDSAFRANRNANIKNLEKWNTSNVVSMNGVFIESSAFDHNISSWQTGRVRSMVGMFQNCTNFSQDLGDWDVSNVTDMTRLFGGANWFNCDLSRWDVSKVESMNAMFASASRFNGSLKGWDVRNVKDMGWMFRRAKTFNQDLSSWDVRNVTKMYLMFSEALSFNGNIDNWNVSSVTDMSQMFELTRVFNRDLSQWDVRNVTNMSFMFKQAEVFNGNVDNWNVSSVRNMNQMFYGARKFNRNLSSWDVRNVTTMNNMFTQASAFKGDLSSWNVSSLKSWTDFLLNSGHENTSWEELQKVLPTKIFKNTQTSTWEAKRPDEFK
ncbi:BspA family leucine-rich repeat surface protein [Mycoplasma cottewii]|uniref:BspA family leucine-rich repeat surface protein n=1 Tax=Mycoplasma cottewii TaxID=51364 RepID=A0ABY5TVL6_9MOLU|nr:BspA family leucine-rich repeat surface protein [Mycoplasma cottewii]UWD34714.1 BspA family leucine-rich repeat surface protein [Mycoplasma cottewii]